jgi:hypothetical protein
MINLHVPICVDETSRPSEVNIFIVARTSTTAYAGSITARLRIATRKITGRARRNASQPQPNKKQHHEGPSAAEPQPNLGVSPAKTPRPQRSEKNEQEGWQNYSTFGSELGVLCALAGVNFPVFEYSRHRKICAGRANFDYTKSTNDKNSYILCALLVLRGASNFSYLTRGVSEWPHEARLCPALFHPIFQLSNCAIKSWSRNPKSAHSATPN